eukprot:gene1698-1726_t
MRKWHRWLSTVFALFLLWIAVTGVLSQIVPLFGGEEDHQKPVAASPGTTPAFVCPADYTCQPKAKAGGAKALVGLLHHLHSGESFGPAGVVIATLSGFAMVFFAFSGLWIAAHWHHAGSGNDLPLQAIRLTPVLPTRALRPGARPMYRYSLNLP